MNKKLALILAIVMIVTFGLAGCGGGGSSDNVLNWNVGAEPKTIDPGLNSAIDGGHVINNTFEGLYRDFDGDGTYEPAIAESYTVSEDQKVYTFKLRETKWSDGQPLTAKDFVWAWKRAIDPKTASEYGYIFSPIKNATAANNGEMSVDEVGVKAIDDLTLEVTLENPCEYFIGLTGFATLMPLREDMVGDDINGAWAINPETAICNGPFKLTEYKTGDKMVLSKNENYWQADKVKLDAINGYMIVEESTALTKFQAGEIDFYDNCPTDEIAKLKASGDLEILPYIGTYFFALNLKNSEVMQDIKVRQALNYAIDRQAICDTVSKAGEQPATGFTPIGFTDNNGKDFAETSNAANNNFNIPTTADVEKAKALLAEAGYPNGEGFPQIEILYNTNEGHKAIAEAVQAMLKQNLNIDVVINNQEWAVFQDSRNELTYKDIARHGWIGDYLDPQTMLEIFETGNPQNNTGWSNAAYDAAMQKAKTTIGEEHFKALYEAQEILMADLPIIPVYYYVNKSLVSERVVDDTWYLSALGKYWFGFCELK